MAHRAALISVSIALSQTPAYAARPRMRGSASRGVSVYSQPKPVPIYTAWWTEVHACEQLAQSCTCGGTAGNRTRDLLITNPTPYRYTTKPHYRKAKNLRGRKDTLAPIFFLLGERERIPPRPPLWSSSVEKVRTHFTLRNFSWVGR